MMRRAGTPALPHRAGASLIELLIAMVVISVLGAALIRTMISSNRFIDRIESGREARGTARAALNLVSTELRMVSAGSGIEAASATGVTVRVPYRLGLSCTASVGTPGVLVAAMQPADTSIATPDLGYNGFAVLQADGEYAYINGPSLPSTGATLLCTAAPVNISVVAGGSVMSMVGANIPTAVDPGTPVVLWRRVRYEFAASTTMPGRTALWRRTFNNLGVVTQSEELAAPLDAASRFGFFINNGRQASDTVPTSLANLRGLELRLTGESVRVARGAADNEQSRVLMSILFLNRPD